MKKLLLQLISMLFWCATPFVAPNSEAKEFLTDAEITVIQENQEIDLRVKFYLQFAELRLKTAEDKLNGIEPDARDPFEFLTPEEMLNAYYRILRSVMINLEDAHSHADARSMPKIRRALKTLKGSSKKALVQLDNLKRIAEEKNKDELWDLANQAIDITTGAREGAEAALAKDTDTPAKQKKRQERLR